MRTALRRSLDRLRTDYIDLYLIHFPDASVPIGETLEALTAEVRAGHVRAIGCSNYSSRELQDALDTASSLRCSRFEVIQPSYSLGTNPVGVYSYPVGLLELEDNIFPICRKEQIAVTTYSPLAVGMLSGKYTRHEPPKQGSRFARNSDYVRVYLTDRNLRIADRLRRKADELGVPMARLAMAWAMSHPLVTSVIIGARLTEHIDSALEAQTFKMEPALRREMTSWTR
jgi:aryl-alcohol dehydrogenase-like predicted oxidoreductase